MKVITKMKNSLGYSSQGYFEQIIYYQSIPLYIPGLDPGISIAPIVFS